MGEIVYGFPAQKVHTRFINLSYSLPPALPSLSEGGGGEEKGSVFQISITGDISYSKQGIIDLLSPIWNACTGLTILSIIR